jgi:malonyl-CoA/methylmalonyl-CoA synthetase
VNGNLYQRFPDLIQRSDRTALIVEEGEPFSFAALAALSGRLMAVLREAGAGPGARVAVKVDKSIAALALYLACLRLGAIYLPLNPAYTPGETAYILEDAEPALFVHDPEEAVASPCASHSLDAAGQGSLMAAARQAPACDDVAAVDENDIAAILYTSGTTGRPKGAMLSHGNLASNAATLAAAWQFSADDILLHALPLFHAHGLFVAVNVSLTVGSTMFFLPRFEAERVLAHLPRATVYMGVPTHYARLLASPGLSLAATAHMRLFVSGSAPLTPTAFAAFAARTGHQILERYGMTETVMNCSNPYAGPRRPGSVGPPLPGIEVRVGDEEGTPVPPGAVGILEVRGPNVFKGYWRNPEKTAQVFRADGFFITGDLARIDATGAVHLVGRVGDMIITGGLNVYPREVEDQLNRLPGVAEAAVIGVPHPDFGEAVVALIVGDAGGEADLIAALRAHLAGYKLPKRVIAVEALPRNAMGKVEKARLRTAYRDLFSAAAT